MHWPYTESAAYTLCVISFFLFVDNRNTLPACLVSMSHGFELFLISHR